MSREAVAPERRKRILDGLLDLESEGATFLDVNEYLEGHGVSASQVAKWRQKAGLPSSLIERRREIDLRRRDSTNKVTSRVVERACKAVCVWCRLGHQMAAGGNRHSAPGRPFCAAAPIRAEFGKDKQEGA